MGALQTRSRTSRRPTTSPTNTPRKLAQLKKDFLALAEENIDFPIGAGNWLRLHPEDRIATPYSEWVFSQGTRRMPEFAAPGVGRQSTEVVIELEVGEKASGVLYAVGGAGGGLTVYLDEGYASSTSTT